MLYSWAGFWARPNQVLPAGDWRFWLLLAGRGFGKTRTGAETVRQWAADPKERILMIAPIASDVREVMIEGPGGLMSCYPPESRPLYEPTRHLVSFPSGAVGITRSADEPDRLRGPQFTKFWADELCAWRYAQEAFDQIMFGFRLQSSALQGVITTTPKPIKILRDLIQRKNCVITRGSSYENRANLSADYYADVIKPYEGTRLGRQEIWAEILDDIPGALWTRANIDAYRVELHKVPPLVRVVVAIDPAVTATENSDETGIGAAGIASNGHVYVLEDVSQRSSPAMWARAACKLMLKWQADRVVAEVNNGGDLVEANIRGVHPDIPFRAVRASRGKAVRAEPAASLYERGLVHHVKTGERAHDEAMEVLEDQLCSFVPGVTEKSPDRMDWLVWAITDLVIAPAESRILVVQPGYQISPI